jgi:uncharacterized protein with HEPN domain
MTNRDIKLYLKDILEAMETVEKFVEDMNFEQFKNNDLVSSAVIRKFEIIGEATRNIPQEIKKKYPDIPWKTMVGFRDKLIHFYFGIKYDIVWETIKSKLPELKEKIKKILEQLEEVGE